MYDSTVIRAAALAILSSLLLGGSFVSAEGGPLVQNCAPAFCFPAVVDDDAPGDPGPGDPTVSDPLENGSEDHPFDSVREAIDILLNPCSLILRPGFYHEDLYTPSSGCIITGSGRSVTVIRSVSGLLMDSFLDSEDPSFPPVLSISDVTLEGGELVVFGGGAPGAAGVMEVTIRDAALSGVWSDFHFGGFGGDDDRMQVTLESVDLTGSDIRVEAQGGVVDLTVASATMAGGSILLQASGVHTNTEITALSAPSTTIDLNRSSGGRQSVHLRDSTVATLDTRSVDYSASATVENVHFTGAGVLTDHGEGILSISIADSTFDNGGVSAISRPDIDTGSDTSIRIARSVFLRDGVTLSENMWAGQLNGVTATLDIDSSLFLGKGVSTTVEHSPWDGSNGGTFHLQMTNNIFDSPTAGVSIDYRLADPGPGSAQADLRALLVNNTFVGCGTGVKVHTTPHLPGQDTVTTLIQNNIIADGELGVEVDGTDGHQFEVLLNDVHDNSLGNYVGDISDQTGLNGNISADPLFRDPAAHDFRLSPASPCVDAGGAGAAVPSTDHAGTPRPVDGNLDGVAESDMGAFEFAPVDEDSDGYFLGEDCDDTDPAINPGAVDLPGNAVDEDCDGTRTCDTAAFYRSHGLFVRCVVHACGELVSAGAVSQAECHDLIVQATRSDVGRKMRTRKTETRAEP